MNKSILVIDTPENCIDCRLCSCVYGTKSCIAADRAIFLENKENKPSWCPLKNIPTKMDIDRERQVSIVEDCYNGESDETYLQGKVQGWNSCIDELMSEE